MKIIDDLVETCFPDFSNNGLARDFAREKFLARKPGGIARSHTKYDADERENDELRNNQERKIPSYHSTVKAGIGILMNNISEAKRDENMPNSQLPDTLKATA